MPGWAVPAPPSGLPAGGYFLVILLLGIGGYSFNSLCNLTRFWAFQKGENHLYYQAALGGLGLLGMLALGELLIRAYTSEVPPWEALLEVPHWKALLTGYDLLGKAFIGAVISAPLAWAINLFYSKEKGRQRALSENVFDRYIQLSLSHGIPLLLSFRDRKIYVGFVNQSPDPRDRRGLSIIPLLSGMRDQETGTVRFPTDYRPLYENLGDELDLNDYEVVLSREHLLSLRLFQPEAFDFFTRTHKLIPPLIDLATNCPSGIPANGSSSVGSRWGRLTLECQPAFDKAGLREAAEMTGPCGFQSESLLRALSTTGW